MHATDLMLRPTCSQLGMVGMEGLWPSQRDAPGFQGIAEAFMAHCHRVSEQLLGSFAAGLGLEPDFFNRVSTCLRYCYRADPEHAVMMRQTCGSRFGSQCAASVLGPYACIHGLAQHECRFAFLVSSRMLTCAGSPAQHHDPSKEDCSLTLRCLHYPPVDNTKIPANYWRAGSHTDFDTLTLLFQVRRLLVVQWS